MASFRVTTKALNCFPLKSAAGNRLEQAQLLDTGIANDRQWLLVDSQGSFVTQRQLPQLGQLKVIPLAQGIQLEAAGSTQIVSSDTCQTVMPIRIWDDECRGLAAPFQVNQWLSQVLEEPVTLLLFDPRSPRPVAPDRFGEGHTLFADAAPLLITNTSSLDTLNTHLANLGEPPVCMSRFRANIVLEGLPAFAEHSIQQIRHSKKNVVIQLHDHCQRCSIISLDPNTGDRSAPQLLRQLAQLNSMPNNPKAPAFGVNASIQHGIGEFIEEGDEWIAEAL